MTSRIREIGRIEDSEGLPVIVGVNYDLMTIDHDPHESSMSFGQDQVPKLMDLLARACWEAARCHQCDCPPEYQPKEARDDIS